MRWIVTVDATVDLQRIDALLKSAGATQDAGSEAIPVDHELALEVEGPRDLPQRLRPNKEIKEVYPSSPMTAY